MMREKHGIEDGKKMPSQVETQSVDIIDGHQIVELKTGYERVGLTPEQARFLAAKLVQSAMRVDKRHRTAVTVLAQHKAGHE